MSEIDHKEVAELLRFKVKSLEEALWDSKQLVSAKSHNQIELREKIRSLEEANRKDMAWRGERICELEDLVDELRNQLMHERAQRAALLPSTIEPEEVRGILDPTANPDDYACCVGSEMWNKAIASCLKALESGKVTIKGDPYERIN